MGYEMIMTVDTPRGARQAVVKIHADNRCGYVDPDHLRHLCDETPPGTNVQVSGTVIFRRNLDGGYCILEVITVAR